MEKELQKIKDLLKERGLVKFEGGDIDGFIKNWMPQGNQDYQQEYFLMELRTIMYELLTLKTVI